MDRPFYSVTFGDKNSWDEWALAPVHAGKIEFATPTLKYESVELPGSDGVLDLTEVLTGYPLFNPRIGSVRFRFYNNGVSARSRFDRLKNYLHGRWMRAVIEDQPEYYYEGRFTVGDFEPLQGNWGDVEIGYNLNAYKLDITDSTEDWLWDPFNFETGVIREYGRIQLPHNRPIPITVVGSRKPNPLKVVISLPDRYESYADDVVVTLEYGDATYTLSYGTNVLPNLVLQDGEHELIFTLTPVIIVPFCFASIEFRGGSL